MATPRFAIIGAGNGGQSFAAHLTLLGFPVTVWDIEPEKVVALQRTGCIRVTGAVVGEAAIACVTGDIGEAARSADVLMIVLPTVYHASVARLLAPHLCDGQTLVLNPGGTGGALEVMATLNAVGCRASVVIAETDTLLYACRSPLPGQAIIHGIKTRVMAAALPAREGPAVVRLLNTAFPQFTAAPTVLVTSLMNGNAIMHPGPTVLNAGRIECKADFEYYSEGITPAVAQVVERLDAERLAVARALGVQVPSIREWYGTCYGVGGASLYDIVQQVRAYDGIRGPTSLNVRYLFEDVPTGLVPMAALAEAVGVRTPLVRAVIDLANGLLGRDFWQDGRSLARLGLAGLSAADIRQRVMGE
jgi:opine dehydrogenase